MAFALLVTAGERDGETFPIPQDRALTLGRDASNDIQLVDRKLSRIHCQVEVIGGHCQINDLNSTNGTVVRGVRIEAETPLNLNDEVEVGMTRLRLIEIAPAEASLAKQQRKPPRPAAQEQRGGPVHCEECGVLIPAADVAAGNVRTVGTRYYCMTCSAPLNTEAGAGAPPPEPLSAAILERFQPGKELAGVRVIGPLGQGRLGPLFKGEQISMGRLVSLKILNVSDVDWAKKYLQAVYVSGQLVHANILLIFDTGEEADIFYVVREYVEGRSAQEQLANHEPMPLAAAHSVISQVVYALEHAAERHIFHGTLSPRRVLLGPRETVKVSGFGLPWTPPPGRSAPTYTWHSLPYTAPERLRGNDPPDLAGDVYAVVALFYHLLSGRPPFSGSTREKLEQRILSRPPKPLEELAPDAPPSAQKIIDRGLSKDPRARYQLPREFLFDIEEALRQNP